MSKRHLISLKRCCCVFAMKKVGLRETEARPGRPCWDWICGLEYMSNTRKAHAGTLAAEIRRQKRCADAEGLASKLCEMTGRGSSGHLKKRVA
jgi:hypothetical protein